MDRMQPEMGISQDRLFAARIIEQGRELLAGIQRLGVAFSGGVDSSVLLALAQILHGPVVDHAFGTGCVGCL
jgi:tRNA(Ile)-lysidine synthase TilS/MesJ